MSPKRKPTPEPAPDEPVFVGGNNDEIKEPTEVLSKPEATEKEKKGRGKGVFIPFDEQGKIDTKRLRGEDWKVDAVKSALLSSGAIDRKGAGMEVSEDFVKGLYKGFEFALQRVGTMVLKWPRDLAALMHYSPEQLRALTPPTVKIIEKFAPSWLVGNQEIAAFAVIFATETGNMVQGAMVEYVRAHPELLVQPQPKPNGHAAPSSENRPVEAAGAD